MDRFIIANVIKPVRRRARAWIGLVTEPPWVRLSKGIGHPDHALHNIVNVGEIPPMITVVKNIDGLAL